MSGAGGEIRLDRIRQIAINVEDVDRAAAFYRDTLGVPFLFSAPPGLAFFECDGVRLMLGRAENPELDHPSSVLYFQVDDIERVHRELLSKGVAFLSKPHVVHRAETHDLWIADFRDGEGNILALLSETPRG